MNPGIFLKRLRLSWAQAKSGARSEDIKAVPHK
jgi:hypothetical protein